MLTLQPSTQPNANVQLLYEECFPLVERRDWAPQVRLLEEGHLKLSYILSGEEFAGFLFYWKLDGFTYIEHFALLESMRGNGMGTEVMALFCKTFPAIILEVEPPGHADADRRIRFYEQNGFGTLPYPYQQPPYRQGEAFIDMVIMYKGMGDGHEVFRKVRSELYSRVYVCRPPAN